jgi:cytochrome c553
VQKIVRGLFILAGFAAVPGSVLLAHTGGILPLWAYGTVPAWRAAASLPGGEPHLRSLDEKNAPLHLPGTTVFFTPTATFDPYAPVDWYPNEHASMPELVAHGRKTDGVIPCALCHHPDGYGRPENANIRGLRADYIVAQLEAFKNGERTSADPQKSNTRTMITVAKGLTHDEMVTVAAYYAQMRAIQSHERFDESATAPKVWSDHTGAVFSLAAPNEGWAPLVGAIIEVPEDPTQSDVYRNPHAVFVAYVPLGSIARGKALATTGGAKTTACGTCHGADFTGTAIAPPLAGRWPSYIARQLSDIQHNTRRNAPAMIPVVSQLSPEDIVDLSAYLGSLPPQAPAHSR